MHNTPYHTTPPEEQVIGDFPHPNDDLSWLLMGDKRWVKQAGVQLDLEFEVTWPSNELAIATSVASAVQMLIPSAVRSLPYGHWCALEAMVAFLEASVGSSNNSGSNNNCSSGAASARAAPAVLVAAAVVAVAVPAVPAAPG